MNKTILVCLLLLFTISTVAFAKEFIDVDDSISTYKDAISYLSEKEVISGYPDGSFKPKNPITRAEVIKIIVTSFNIEFKDGSNKSFAFDDIKGKWFEDHVKIGASNGIIKGYEDGTFRPDNNVTYGELCAMVCRLLNMNVNEGEDWARAYLNAAGEAGLLDNISSNDLVAIGKASRMNVAMVIYNALNVEKEEQKPSGETNNQEVKPEENKEPEQEKELADLDLIPNKNYFGRVVLEIERSVKNSIDVEVFDEGTVRFDVKDEAKKPTYGSLLVFYVRKDGGVKIVKELKKSLINSDNMLVVEAAQGSLAKLEDVEEDLDISLSEYTLNGNTIKLGKYDYYFLEVALDDKDEYEYINGKEIKQEEIRLMKEDRIIFDTSNKQCFIVRGIEED